MAATAEAFDYVIVGAGSAGGILANRLSESGANTVCVLEAGPKDRDFFIHVPAGFMKTLFNPKITWPFVSEPVPGLDGRIIATTQGRTLGGGSSLNGMIYNRGQPADFDGWAQRGNPGWGYDDVLPYFKRTEGRLGAGDNRYRGRAGSIPITDNDWDHPLCEAFIDAAGELGLPRNPDYNGEHQAGAGYYQRNIHKGRRVSTADAFLRPALKRPGVVIRTEAQASQILIREGRAVGLRYLRGPETVEVTARKGVILSAGAMNSPKLLQLSGIGPAALLREHGIELRADLPGVGENLQDHYSPRLVARVKGSDSLNARVGGIALGLEIAKWAVGMPNILAISPALAYGFGRSDPSMDNPDFALVFTPGSFKQGYIGRLDDFQGMTCGAWRMRPESRGFVRIVSTDPRVFPAIQPNYLDHPADRSILIAALKTARRLFETAPLAHYLDAEVFPGAQVQSDDVWLAFAKQYGGSSNHAVGTCKMGLKSDPFAVVDHELKVHGVDGLHVIDASIMPAMVSANTHAAALMIGEKGADLVLGRSSAPAPGL